MAVSLDSFRPMVADDVLAVLVLERSVFSLPWTEAMLVAEMSAPGHTYLVADGEVGVTAYGGIMVSGSEAHIMTIAVDGQYRRNRTGTRLLLVLIELALAGGAKHLTLELRVSNQAAIRLYQKFGFMSVGIWPSYYTDEDALVMWVVDAASPDYRRTLDRIREGVA